MATGRPVEEEGEQGVGVYSIRVRAQGPTYYERNYSSTLLQVCPATKARHSWVQSFPLPLSLSFLLFRSTTPLPPFPPSYTSPCQGWPPSSPSPFLFPFLPPFLTSFTSLLSSSTPALSSPSPGCRVRDAMDDPK